MRFLFMCKGISSAQTPFGNLYLHSPLSIPYDCDCD